MELSHLLELVSELPVNSKLTYVRGTDECRYLGVELDNIRINAEAPNGESKSWAPSYLEELAPKIDENEPFNLSGLLNNKGSYRPVLETIIAHTREFYWVRKGSAIEIVWIPSMPKSLLNLEEILAENIPPKKNRNSVELIVCNSLKPDYSSNELSQILKDMYAASGTLGVHLFGLKYGAFLFNLKNKNSSVKEIVVNAGLSENYVIEINKLISVHKGIKDNLFGLSFFEDTTDISVESKDPCISKTDITYLRAMRTKPFLLLAGISGTGKSRIVKQLAFKSCSDNAVLRKDPTSPGNYCLVEVKPNWHDSTELLGYESQIKNGYVLTPFVRFLAKAMLHPETPFFVCLDEMNLAPVEQYFAEFLSVLESRKRNENHITSEALIPAKVFASQDLSHDLFDIERPATSSYNYPMTVDVAVDYGKEFAMYDVLKEEGLRIPENVIVIGTVNMDETTHQFSRKVIDRAMTIEMNIADGTEPFSNFFEKYEDLGYTENPLPKELFLPKYVSADQALAEMDSEVVDYLKAEVPVRLSALNDALNGSPFKIAYRVQNELVLYFSSLLADTPEGAKEDLLTQAIDGIMMMKVLPRIEGDEDLLKKPLDKLANFAHSYPLSVEKIKEMRERLERGHFTSFWP